MPRARGTANDNRRAANEDGPFGNDTIAYSYDVLGRVSSRQIASSTDSFAYDMLGRVQSHSVQDIAVFTYGYLGNSGQVASRTAVNLSTSLVTSYGYDTNANDRRLLTITNTGSAARNYSYTSNPYQITGISETMPPGHPWVSQTRTYGYDASDRLLTATASTAGNKSYGYDKLDNATSFAGVTGTYNSLNQINTFNGTSYTYDNNGNLTSDGTRTYTYDAADRLVRINYTGSTAKSEFGYDGLGRRVVLVETPATGSAVTSRYLWCGATICQERDGSNTVTRRYYAGEGERRPTTFESYAYMTDHLGSVREMVGLGTGIMKFAFDYDAYGNSERTWTNTSTPWTNQRYAGLFYHPTSGLYLSATRAYNPANGKWLNVDPIREAGGINLTGYVGASPSMDIDPLGTAGGSANPQKGAANIRQFLNDVGPMFDGIGGYKTGTEVKMSVAGIDETMRWDVASFNKDTGHAYLVEGKSGPRSRYTQNQKICIPELIKTGQARFFGTAAEELGMTNGAVKSVDIITEPMAGSRVRPMGVARYLGPIGMVYEFVILPSVISIKYGPGAADQYFDWYMRTGGGIQRSTYDSVK